MKTLRAYQEIAFRRACERNLLIGDDRGLGKTVTAIEAARALMQQLNAPTLLIVPKTLKTQWSDEIAEQEPNCIVIWLDADTPISTRFTNNKAFWVLAHYESLVRHHKTLAKTLWGAIIIDEAHRIKNRQAQRTVALKKLRAHRKIALTGTPYDRNPADIWSILNWLRPDVFKSYWTFFEAHVQYDGTLDGPKTIRGVRDAERFTRVIAPHMIRRAKADVAPQLPPKIEQHIQVEMTPAQATLYARIKQLAETDLHLDTGDLLLVKNHLGRILRLQQAAVDPMLLGTNDQGAKIAWLLDYIEDNPNDTLLIFTRFRDTALRVANLLQIPAYVGGALLEKPEQYPKIVATIDAAKEGLNLGHIWNTIFLDCHWSSIAMAQAIDRTERDLAAIAPRVIMYLHALDRQGAPTIDALVRSALEAKWDTAELINAWLRKAS